MRAAFILALKMWAGDLEFTLISIPRYLKTSHYFNFTLFTYKSPTHYTNITSVFLVFITKSFASQNSVNIDNSYYNYYTPGAIRTRSSAKARKNKLRQATVKAVRWDLVQRFFSI